jgi:hypothetical protein
LLTEVVSRIMRLATLYYAQRIPSTLGRFVWRVDAKDKAPTNHERLWAEIVKPLLQTMSLQSPQLTLIGADYSACERFMGASSCWKGSRERLPRRTSPSFDAAIGIVCAW